MKVLIGGLVAALIVGWVVVLIQQRRHKASSMELDVLRKSAAESAARVEALQTYAGEQARLLTLAYAEREDLLVDSTGLQRKIRELEQSGRARG